MHQNPIRPPPEGGCQVWLVDVNGRESAYFYSVCISVCSEFLCGTGRRWKCLEVVKWWAVGDLDCPASAYQDKAQVIVIRSAQEEASPGEQCAVPHQIPVATPDPKALPRVQAFPGATPRIRHR